MLDRVSKYPGRVRLTPVPGQEDVFDMTRADEATQAGDPLNKATLLRDATAALFGLDNFAVPDDVLAYLGRYNLHWWQRKTLETVTTFEEKQTLNTASLIILSTRGTTTSATVSYSTKISFDEAGNILLVTPQTAKVSYTTAPGQTSLFSGHYISIGSDSKIYYIRSGAMMQYHMTEDNSDVSVIFLANDTYTVSSIKHVLDVGETDYVHSSDRNAYPDSGVSDGFEWQYLGVPFENAVTAPKIETGSYTGTETVASTGGYSKTLTFAKIPDMIFILGKNNTNGNMSFAFVTPVGGKGTQPNSTGVATGLQALSATTTENSITWSGMGEAVQTVKNHTYYYWAVYGGVAS